VARAGAAVGWPVPAPKLLFYGQRF